MTGALDRQSQVLSGISASPGVALGRVLVLGPQRYGVPRRAIESHEVVVEIARFRRATDRAQDHLKTLATTARENPAAAAVLDAYVVMVKDPMVEGEVERHIREELRCAEWGVALAIELFAERLATSKDAYLRERSHDIEYVGEHVLRAFVETTAARDALPEGPVVIVARDLSPADTAALMGEPVVAFITETGTRTSHTAITARALHLPAVVGVTDALSHLQTGDFVIVDALRGSITARPTEEELTRAVERAERYRSFTIELLAAKDQAAVTKDGVFVSLRANVELPDEVRAAREAGAQGIGLYRTEYLFIDRAHPPTEEEQESVFRGIVEAMDGLPVTLRTFDIGGDKFTTNFVAPRELNPMLGLRAVRLALSRPEVFEAHLRAMVRASAAGDVRIMIPMVSNLTEYRKVKAMLDRAIRTVRAAGVPCKENIPLGVMIEVPSAAILADHFAREVGFMSIGTNDLVQYTLAVDRGSRRLAYLASPFDPAVLRLLDNVARAGEAFECPVSVCGAMASDPLAVTCLLGLGIRDLSMESGSVPEIREVVRRLRFDEAQAVARRALDMGTAEEVETLFAEHFAPVLSDLLLDD